MVREREKRGWEMKSTVHAHVAAQDINVCDFF